MFVRKGTVRRGRGSSKRRTTVRKSRRDSLENGGDFRKSGINENHSLTCSGYYELTVDDKNVTSKSTKYGSAGENGHISSPLTHTALNGKTQTKRSCEKNTEYCDTTPKSNPVTSQKATVVAVQKVIMFARRGTLRRSRRASIQLITNPSRRDSCETKVLPRTSTTREASSSSKSDSYNSFNKATDKALNSTSDESRLNEVNVRATQYTLHEQARASNASITAIRHDESLNGLSVGNKTNTILSFDDERQLVRTSVGLDYPSGAEVQPDYDAFLYQIREANKESENIIDFGCKTSNIICNTLFVTVLVGLFMAVPVAMVSVGVKYLEDCPKEPRIPIYLLVGGCFGMIKLLSTLWRNIQARRYHDVEVVFDDHDSDGVFANTTYRTMDNVLFLFLIGWQAAGTYWTLQIWQPHFHQLLHEPSNWCDKTVYMFTIYQLGGSYGVMVVFVLVLLTLICCQRCCYR